MIHLAASALLLLALSSCGLSALTVLSGSAAIVTIAKDVFDLRTDFGRPVLPPAILSTKVGACSVGER